MLCQDRGRVADASLERSPGTTLGDRFLYLESIMPKELHDRLLRQAKRKGLTGNRLRAYVYGTMAKIESSSKEKHGKLAKHVQK